MSEFSQLEVCQEVDSLILFRDKTTSSYKVFFKEINVLADREQLVEAACKHYEQGKKHVVKFTCPYTLFVKYNTMEYVKKCVKQNLSIKIKLKDLITPHWSFADKEKTRLYPDTMIIENSPWVTYLKTGDTSGIEEFFYACRKTGLFPEDYWYDIKLFDNLVL